MSCSLFGIILLSTVLHLTQRSSLADTVLIRSYSYATLDRFWTDFEHHAHSSSTVDQGLIQSACDYILILFQNLAVQLSEHGTSQNVTEQQQQQINNVDETPRE